MQTETTTPTADQGRALAATRDKLKAALGVLFVLSEAVRASGPGGMPSGLLYSAVMDRVDLAGYERAVDTLVNSGVVRRGASHLLYWNVEDKGVRRV